jgi:hypothetical protein
MSPHRRQHLSMSLIKKTRTSTVRLAAFAGAAERREFSEVDNQEPCMTPDKGPPMQVAHPLVKTLASVSQPFGQFQYLRAREYQDSRLSLFTKARHA